MMGLSNSPLPDERRIMALIDRTNEKIPLSLDGGTVLAVDADFDSSFDPPQWVNIDNEADDDWRLRLTYDEARLLHDRLGRILGLVGENDPGPGPEVFLAPPLQNGQK